MRAELSHAVPSTLTKTEIAAEKKLRRNWLGSVSSQYLGNKSGSGSPALDAGVRTIPEIPTLVVDADGSDVLRSKRNFRVAPDLDNAALAYDNLIETPAVLELD